MVKQKWSKPLWLREILFILILFEVYLKKKVFI